MSPVKCSRTAKAEVKYFEGQLSDGKKTVRMVSFEPKLRAEVEQAQVSGEGVALTNCCVKESKKQGCDALEIVAGSRTTVVKSPKKYRIGEDVRCASASVCGSRDVLTLEEIKDLGEGQKVNVTGKVQEKEEKEKVHVKSRGCDADQSRLRDIGLHSCLSRCGLGGPHRSFGSRPHVQTSRCDSTVLQRGEVCVPRRKRVDRRGG